MENREQERGQSNKAVLFAGAIGGEHRVFSDLEEKAKGRGRERTNNIPETAMEKLDFTRTFFCDFTNRFKTIKNG